MSAPIKRLAGWWARLTDFGLERLSPAAPAPGADWARDADWTFDQQRPLRARRILWTTVVVFLGLLAWAGFAEVDEVTRGDGRVIPSTQLQVVQAVDGGVVEKIHVAEGEVVRRRAPLLRIDPTRFVSNLRENRSQMLALTVKAARLEALVNRSEFTVPADARKELPDIVRLEAQLYESTRQELEAQLSIANEQREQRGEEEREATARFKQARRSLELARQELNVTRPLVSSGAVSEVEILRLEREVAQLTGEQDQAAAQIARIKAAIVESDSKIEEVELRFRNRLQAELAETLARLDSLNQTEAGLADRVAKAAVLSPVRGTVKRVLVNTIGAVVQPGQELIEIVPLDDALLLEARIHPRDIGFLRPQMAAVVKFTAYDFAIYGGLDATVEHISGDSDIDENGNAFYLIRLRTRESFIGDNLPIIPGMVAQVDVLTGSKSILDYLLKPILRARSKAFTER